MQTDVRDLLEVLKFELKFLEDGGYGRSPSARWRPQLIFEDSPTCMNFNSEVHAPCSDCVLIQLVPPQFRSAQTPCRRIPFDSSGETLDSLYRYGGQVETEEVVRGWLRATIKRLEGQRAAAERKQTEEQTARSGGTTKGTPLHQKPHPQCPNPACPAFQKFGAAGLPSVEPQKTDPAA